MYYWAEFLTVALIHLLAVASPGPDFAVVVRESVTHGRKAGTWTAMGVGTAISDKKHMEDAVSAMSDLTGQKPLVCKSKKSIANFRLREGLAIGCKVTLRGSRMYEFLDRLVSLALPRVRDFRGLNPDAFDGHGNYSLGLTEQLVFPELNPDKYLRPQGMNIAICCSAGSDDESREMLRLFGVPFRGENDEK